MRATRAFNGMSRIALVLAVMVWMVQGCVVTAEKKILVAQDTTAEDQATPPDTTGAEDTFTDETDGGVEPDGIGPAKTAWDIGPEGGSFLFDGGVKLIVPPDAFPQVITVEVGIMGGATTPDGVFPLTAVWVIPDLEDLVFNQPVLLVLPLLDDLPSVLPEGASWDQLGGFTQPLGGEEWAKLPASVDLLKGELSIPTMHFSLFFGGLGGGGTTCTPEVEVCNGLDDDCDGAIDQGACQAGDTCFMSTMCASGTCAWVYGGTEAVCAETADGCAILLDEVLTQVEDGAIVCTGESTYRQCKEGAFSESAPCSEGFENTFLCVDDEGEAQCAGECGVDGDCVDADLCDGGKACQQGMCVDAGVPVTCDPDTDCSTWTCVPATGLCTEAPKNAGGPCSDGDACTEGDQCQGTTCTPGDKVECGDGDDCTADSCDPATGGCIHDIAAMVGETCDDGVPCTIDDVCDAQGDCAGTVKDCDDLKVCTTDSCDPLTGACSNVALTGEPCDDEDACTDNDVCSAVGTCAGFVAVDCDDLNDCTVDACNPGDGSCEHGPAALGASCSYPDANPDSGSACFPSAKCNDVGVCQSGAGVCDCVTDGDCQDDGDLCNGTPKCDKEVFPYICVDDPTTVVECGPGGTCFELVCEPGTGDCLPSGINEGGGCDDEDVCTTGETCVAGACAADASVDCGDGDPCTLDVCDPVEGCSNPPAPALPCDDADACTLNTCTADGSACLYDPIPGCCASDGDCDGVPCIDGACCVPTCDDGEGGLYECGADGCGGTCGACEGNETCNDELHLCICETCCQDSSECGALEICLDPDGGGNTLCTPLTPLFQANFDDETAGAPSTKFVYSDSWLYNLAWVVYEASGAPAFANSPTRSLRYNLYKSDGWLDFSVNLPAGGEKSFVSFMLLCPGGAPPNWTLYVKGDGGTLNTVQSASVCASSTWHHIVTPVTSLGGGNHAFRLELDNEAFATIYLDDVVVVSGN